MTPSNSISSWWPPGIVWPPLRLQVATTPDLLHPPTVALFAVTSLTNVFPSAVVMSLPVGNVTVILALGAVSVPPGEVVKSTRYSERAPAAGVVTSVTDGFVTDDACATPADAPISSTVATTRSANRRDATTAPSIRLRYRSCVNFHAVPSARPWSDRRPIRPLVAADSLAS